MLQQTHSTQHNGIGSFSEVSPDYELAPIGLGSFQDQARKLAEFGRNGDIYVVHAAEGETVIPMEVLNANPKVRELLFGQMREMGLDPQEFVVGNDLNSINPVTGLPEFFFSSVFRAVKNVFKKVAGVVKKVAPIVLPMAAAAFGIPFLGPAFGAGTFGAAFLGGGIGTLVGGGNLKDALKSGLVSGGTSLAFSGIGSLFNPGTSIGDAISSNFTGKTPIYDSSGTLMGHKMAASPWAIGSRDAAKASAGQSKAQWDQILGRGTEQDIIAGSLSETMFAPEVGPGVAAKRPGFVSDPTYKTPTVYPVYPEDLTGMGYDPKVDQPASFWDQAGDAMWRGGKSVEDIAANATKAEQAYIAKHAPGTARAAAGIQPTGQGLKAAAASAQPSMLEKYGPTAALGLGGAYLSGAFDTVDEAQPVEADLAGFTDLGPSGAELIEQDPSKYLIAGLDPITTPLGTPLIPSTFPALNAARGGMVEKGIGSLASEARKVRGAGRGRDTVLAHITPGEAAQLQRGTRRKTPRINPKTGLPEFDSPGGMGNAGDPGGFGGFGGNIGDGQGAGVGFSGPGGSSSDASAEAMGFGGTDSLGVNSYGSAVGPGPSSGIFGSGISGSDVLQGIASLAGMFVGGFPGIALGLLGPAIGSATGDSTGETIGSVAGALTGIPGAGFLGGVLGSEIGDPGSFGAGAPAGFGAGAPAGIGDLAGGNSNMGPGAVGIGGTGVQGGAPAGVQGGAPQLANNPVGYAPAQGYTYNAPYQPLIPTTFPALNAARGGLAEFPRRDLLVEGPGTERSDDIPAMLSDGEFVINARAVRGADPTGRGNRYAGSQNLYNMMRNFEMRA